MTREELYEQIRLPGEIIEQLKEYEGHRRGDIPAGIREKLFARGCWDEGIKELRAYLGDDPCGIRILWEQLNLALSYTYEEYMRRGIPGSVFADTFGFVSRFILRTKEIHGKYKYDVDWWLPRQISLQEFRIGCLEYEFVESEESREIKIHIPSDADMRKDALCQSVMDFLEFQKKYLPDWGGVEITTFTWMIIPELEEILPETSNILAFKSLFDIDYVDYEHGWHMGWVFPGCSEINENLPEKTSLQRKLKEHLLAGKRFGNAKGHLVLDRVYGNV